MRSNTHKVTNPDGEVAIFDSLKAIQDATPINWEAVVAANKKGRLENGAVYQPRDFDYKIQKFPLGLVQNRVIEIDGFQYVVLFPENARSGKQTVELMPFNPESL